VISPLSPSGERDFPSRKLCGPHQETSPERVGEPCRRVGEWRRSSTGRATFVGVTNGLAPGTIFAGDYRVVRPLSAGGMGAVYVVEQLSTQKQRALKLMHPQLAADEASRRRFDQEARVGARIPSDHVVEVTAAGVDAATGAPFLVMELLEGEDLDALLRRRQRLSPIEAGQVMEQICHAVGAAHAAGIVHRDLKPGNVFLATARRTDVAFTVKVLDFGIAKLVSEQSAETAAMGSPLWLAPEQTERRAVTPATDVWALGLIAYTLLTGKSYWRTAVQPDASLMQVMREVLFDPLEPASIRAAAHGAELPPSFDSWFARCLAREPASRYQNASQLFADLAPLLGYQRSGAVPPVGSAPLVAPVGAVPYVTRYDSGSVAGALGVPGASLGVPGVTPSGAPFAPAVASPPAATTSGAALATRSGRGGAGGLLALGCAGTALVASLLVVALTITAVVLFRGAPAAPVSVQTPSASADARGEPTAPDSSEQPSDEAAALADEAQPSDRAAGHPPGRPRQVAPIGPAADDAPAPERAVPEGAATPPKSNRKAVVTTLLGGSNVAGLPPDGNSVVRSRIPGFTSCYERGIAGDDEDHFGESMIMYLHINADGSLRGVESRIDSAPPGVGTCVFSIVRSLRFSAPPAGPVQGNLIISFKTERR